MFRVSILLLILASWTAPSFAQVESVPPPSPGDAVGDEPRVSEMDSVGETALEDLLARGREAQEANDDESNDFDEPFGDLTGNAARADYGRVAEIARALEVYRRTGDAAILKRSATAIFPFDESQPVVHCSPLRVCDIELEAGEIVTGVSLGAPELWVARKLESGSPEKPIPHVIVQPRDYDLATNLVIGTTRRTYHLGLVSTRKSEVLDGAIAYNRHVAFYYPADFVETWADIEQLAAKAEEERLATAVDAMDGFSVQDFNFGYEFRKEKKARKTLPWLPQAVFDDGQHVYIRFPTGVASSDLPTLLVKTSQGEMAVGNFRVDGRWMVYDGLFSRAELVSGVGRKRQRLVIVNTTWPLG